MNATIKEYIKSLQTYNKTPKLGVDGLYHYVYLITNNKNDKFYKVSAAQKIKMIVIIRDLVAL